VVVLVDVMQVIAVSAVVVISTVCPGRIGVLESVAEAPGAQNAVLVAPVLLARTDLPAVNEADETPPVVAVIGVRELSVWKPVTDAVTLAFTQRLPLMS
jgi:hypothetical protein